MVREGKRSVWSSQVSETVDTKKLPLENEPLSSPLIIDVDAYISQDYAKAEQDKLWRKVWLQAGRVEELTEIGSYLTYEIGVDSILIVRTANDVISAYHNVCQHRGRRLVDTPDGAMNARGKTRRFACGFHGWCWDIRGRNVGVPGKSGWKGAFTDENLKLPSVQVDVWGGWIWVNLDPECEPLRDYLEPAASMLDPFELENMRYKWRRWLVFDCNWKVAIEAFIESYHVPATHPEFMRFAVYTGWAKLKGKHCAMGYDAPEELGETQARLRLGSGSDPRVSTAEMVSYTLDNVGTNFTETLRDVAHRLKDELPEGTPADEVLKYWLETSRQQDADRGVAWPTVDPEHTKACGYAWQVFPNFRIGHAVNNALCYNVRPFGDDPDKCIFEVSVFELFAKGEEPETEWEYTPEDDERWGSVLVQDFSNMAAVQRGMKSLGFRGARPHPKEERAIVALHHILSQYMGKGAPHEDRQTSA